MSREWLYIEPHGQFSTPAGTDVGTPGAAAGWGVPRVVGWGQCRGGLDQYIGGPGPVYIRPEAITSLITLDMRPHGFRDTSAKRVKTRQKG